MKYKAAILTVGNRWEPVEFALREHDIQAAVFICTSGEKGSRKTTLDRVLEKRPMRPSTYKVLEVEDSPNQIGSLCEKVHEAYLWLKRSNFGREEILIDPTAGRKWMSAGATIMGAYLGLELGYVHVDERDGKPDPSTMRVVSMPNVYDQTGLLEGEKAIAFFNRHIFEATEKTLIDSRVGSPFLKDLFESLVEMARGYRQWDLFEHLNGNTAMHLEKAVFGMERVRNQRGSPALDKLIEKIKDHLDLLNELKGYQPPHLLFVFDLIENARRRREQGRLDDAMARLYRALEAISQYFLKKDFDIKTGEPDYMKFSSEVQKRLKAEFKGDPPDKIALEHGFKILEIAGHPAGSKVFRREKKGLRNLFEGILTDRNHSILAHDFDPIESERLENSFERVGKLLTELEPESTRRYAERFKFPVLEKELIYG